MIRIKGGAYKGMLVDTFDLTTVSEELTDNRIDAIYEVIDALEETGRYIAVFQKKFDNPSFLATSLCGHDRFYTSETKMLLLQDGYKMNEHKTAEYFGLQLRRPGEGLKHDGKKIKLASNQLVIT